PNHLLAKQVTSEYKSSIKHFLNPPEPNDARAFPFKSEL
ncbi:hypothetical protein LINPERHAP2_LOCUS32393, partial [Linum perenne]